MRDLRKNRRGQQAMEYMVTYGWAFVVIIVTIGAFAYFGLLNPEKYLPNRCDFGLQLKCVDYLFEDNQPNNGFVYLRFQNTFGEDIRIIDVTTAEGEGTYCFDEGGTLKCDEVLPILDGEVNEALPIVLDLDSQEDYVLVSKDKMLVPIIVTFSRDENGAPQHQVIGEVFATVQ